MFLPLQTRVVFFQFFQFWKSLPREYKLQISLHQREHTDKQVLFIGPITETKV